MSQRSTSAVMPAAMERLPRSNLVRWAVATALLATALCASAAGPEAAAELKRVEAALTRLQEAQQNTFQQFQMAQELRRSELAQPDPGALPASGVAAPPGDYEEIQRRRAQREQRLKDLQAEADRLYAHFQALEEEKRPLLERMQALPQPR